MTLNERHALNLPEFLFKTSLAISACALFKTVENEQDITSFILDAFFILPRSRRAVKCRRIKQKEKAADHVRKTERESRSRATNDIRAVDPKLWDTFIWKFGCVSHRTVRILNFDESRRLRMHSWFYWCGLPLFA